MAIPRWIRDFSWRRLVVGIQPLVGITTFAFGIVGTFAALILPLFNPAVQTSISSAAISGMFALFLVWSIFREYRVARKEKYANISKTLDMISVQAKNLSLNLLEAYSDDARIPAPAALQSAVEQITRILDNAALIFSMLTGTHCRATIKAVTREDEKVWAHALARDTMSALHCGQSDRDRNDRKFDAIQDNIDFEILYDPKKDDDGFYFNNNLPKSTYYSTSLKYRQEVATSHHWKPDEDSYWPLSYRSAIVWPIRQEVNYSSNAGLFYGFLAVDSESANVFEKRWDTAIGALIAHQLVLPLHLYQQLERRLGKG